MTKSNKFTNTTISLMVRSRDARNAIVAAYLMRGVQKIAGKFKRKPVDTPVIAAHA